jgi:hypothetical protein
MIALRMNASLHKSSNETPSRGMGKAWRGFLLSSKGLLSVCTNCDANLGVPTWKIFNVSRRRVKFVA